MKTKSYKATIDVEDGKIKGFIKDLFGDTEEYDKKNKHFNNEKIKDAIFFLNSSVKHEEVPNKIWGQIETIAAMMYLYGFNRAFEYYVEHDDIFNLETNEDTKQD